MLLTAFIFFSFYSTSGWGKPRSRFIIDSFTVRACMRVCVRPLIYHPIKMIALCQTKLKNLICVIVNLTFYKLELQIEA